MSDSGLELLKGTLDVLILKALSWGPAHGYGVSRWIRHATEDALSIEEGALYPGLHRLERRGLIRSEWGLSENNRRARFYQLTAQGRRHLRDESTSFTRFAEAMTKALNAPRQPSWAGS